MREFVASAAWPNWQVAISGGRVRFVAEGQLHREVIWDVTEAELAAHCRAVDADARAAMGSGGHGYHLVQVHLEESLATFEGSAGRITLTPHGLQIADA